MPVEAKTLEVRDRATCIGVVATKIGPADHSDADYVLRRRGLNFGGYLVSLHSLESGRMEDDPYDWRGIPRTMQIAHQHILDHWDELSSGDVVDVEFILGESSAPKVSERKLHEEDCGGE